MGEICELNPMTTQQFYELVEAVEHGEERTTLTGSSPWSNTRRLKDAYFWKDGLLLLSTSWLGSINIAVSLMTED